MSKAVAKAAEAEVIESEAPAERRSIIETMAARYGMEAAAFQATVIATCFPASPPATREEFAAGMQVANKLDLNPLTKEVHFARIKGGGIQAIIGVDGWYAMANRHPQYDGCEFDHEWASPDSKGESDLLSVTCRIFRKDRSRPTAVTEFMAECRRPSEAWRLTPSRMLRHRAFGQCARVAFSFAGIMDVDEYSRWQEDDQPQAIAAPFVQRKSSAEGKRDGSVKRFNDIRAAIHKATDGKECRQLWEETHKETLSTLPRAWFENIAQEYTDKMEGFGVVVDVEEQAQMQAAE